jgi:hypothetical protein
MELAQRRRYIASNPCDAVRLPRKGNDASGKRRAPLRTLTPAQIKQLAQAAPEHYSTALYVVGSYRTARCRALGPATR